MRQGAVMPMSNFATLLSADGQVVNPNRGQLCFLSSDNTTATNRTFTLLNGTWKGQQFVINFNVGSSFTADLQSGGNVQLAEAWQPLQYEILTLNWDGTQWCEAGRSETAIVAGSIVNADINASAAIAYSKLAALTDANLLIGNGSNVATVVAVTGDVTISNAGVTAIGALKVTSAMASDTHSFIKCAIATIDYTDINVAGSGNGVAFVATDGGLIPDNSYIIKAWYEVSTTFVGNGDDSSTLSLGIEDQDNDLVAAAAIKTGTPWDAGVMVETLASDLDDQSTFIKTTAARYITCTWDLLSSDTDLTAGSMKVFCMYIVSGQ